MQDVNCMPIYRLTRTRYSSQAIAFLFVATAILPAHVLAKLIYFLIGFAFWFIVPMTLALTPEERARFVYPHLI